MAARRDRKPTNEALYRVVVVGKLALTCHEYLKKGRQVFVEGRLRTREWESNGTSGRRTEIVATRVQFLGTPPASAEELPGDQAVVCEAEIPA
jgi:single-strand DNA-binding protein